MKVMLFAVLLVGLVSACTNRGTYEGIKASNINECYRLPPSQQDECLEQANKSYEEYQREREELLNAS